MSEPPPESVVYLDVDDALEVFGAIIGGTATQAADQLRDRAALAGALARPINYAQYENADLLGLRDAVREGRCLDRSRSSTATSVPRSS